MRSVVVAALSVLAVPVLVVGVVLAVVLCLTVGILGLVVCVVVLAPVTAVRRKVAARRQYRAVR